MISLWGVDKRFLNREREETIEPLIYPRVLNRVLQKNRNTFTWTLLKISSEWTTNKLYIHTSETRHVNKAQRQKTTIYRKPLI